MPDLNRESLEIWNSLKPMVDEEIKSQTRGAVQRRKAKVTTAPSLSTNKIGVTEPYCAEIFIPFVSNLISATVGDYVWIEFAYGATNAYASMFASSDHKDETVAGNLHVMGNVNVGGVLDVWKRRCEASLGGAGWYRAIIYNAYDENSAKGSSGEIVRIRVVDTSMVSSQHEITLVLAYDNVSFINELSNGTLNLCDEIRYTYSGSFGYVDIHINHATSITYNVSFDVATRTYAIQNWYAGTLASVADSPTGETVLAAHKFTTDTTYKALTFTRTNNSYYNATDFGRITGYSKNDNIYINLNLRTSAAIPANTSSFEIGVITLPANRQMGTSIYMNIPTQDATAAVLLIIYTDGKMTIANYTSSQIGALVFHRAHISNCLIPTT